MEKIYSVGHKKPDCSLRVGNFATVGGRKACDMSKFSEICPQKKTVKLAC